MCPLKGPVSSHIREDLGLNNHSFPQDKDLQFCKTLKLAKAKRPILIGHNLVYDLCFLHTMFVGSLPATLAEFRQKMNSLFPRLFDTKVIVSGPPDPDVINPTLEETLADLDEQIYPSIVSPMGWGYNSTKSFQSKNGAIHNAGYDSKCSRREL